MAYSNQTMLIITLSVNGLNTPFKRQTVRLNKKARPNNRLPTRNPA